MYQVLLFKFRRHLCKGSIDAIVFQIQDGGGAPETPPCWKTAHQPPRRTGIGLRDFHGDTNQSSLSAFIMAACQEDFCRIAPQNTKNIDFYLLVTAH